MNPNHTEDIPQVSSRAKRGGTIFMLLVGGIHYCHLSPAVHGSDQWPS